VLVAQILPAANTLAMVLTELLQNAVEHGYGPSGLERDVPGETVGEIVVS
jgi:hypothetical protein